MKAAIDCGANSMRLLIVDDAGTEVEFHAVVTGLGAGAEPVEARVDRTLDVLASFRAAADAAGAAIRAVGGSALRATTTADRDAFLDRAEVALGVRPVVLSGANEARLAFLGAAGDLPSNDADGLDVVLDIGGGSCEFAVGRAGGFEGAFSIDTGCLRLGAEFWEHDPPGPVALSQAISVVHAHLDDVERELPAVKEATRLVGVGGSILTAAAIELGAYDRDRIHHFSLTREAAEDVFRTVATEAKVDRAYNPGLAPDRVDTIVAGTLILVTAMRHFGWASCLVSNRDLLHGLVAES